MLSLHTLFRTYSRLTKTLATLAVLLGLPNAAMAQDSDVSFYVGASFEFVELNSFAGDSINLLGESTSAVALRGGALFNRYFAAEGEIAFGVENRDDDGIADYNNRFAGYGRVRAPFGETGFEIFARAGYAITDIESRNVIGADGASGADGSSLDGITYGGGVAYNFGANDRFQLRLDYTEFNFGNSQDADIVSIGVGYNF